MSAPITTSNLSMQSFFSTTLSAGISASDTVIPLNAVPTGTEGFLVVDQDNASKEILYFNTKGGSSVTVPNVSTGRGQGGTTAVSHLSGATVKLNMVDQYWSELQNGNAVSKVPVQVASNPYKFNVYRNAAKNAGNGSYALVNCDTKTFDTGSNVDIVTNVGRFTAPIAGFYWFGGEVAASVTTDNQQIRAGLFKNGATIQEGAVVRAGGNTTLIASTVTTLIQLAANDYVELVSLGDAAYALSVGASTANNFYGFLVSKT